MLPYMICYFGSLIICNNKNNSITSLSENGKAEKRQPGYVLVLLLILWTAFFSIKGITGTDSYYYLISYLNIGRQNISFASILNNNSERLFHIVSWFAYKVSKGSWRFACLIYALLIYIPLLKTLQSSADYLGFSSSLFVSTLLCFFGYNGLRQAIAMSFVFAAYNLYFRKKKYLGYSILILIARGFHSAAIMVLPFHFLSTKKFEKWRVFAFSIGTIVAVLLYDKFFGNVLSALDYIGLEKIANDYQGFDEGGSSFLRVLMWLFPLCMGLFSYPRLIKVYPDINEDLWMMLFTALLSVVAVQSWIAIRLCDYLSLNVILYIPKLSAAYSNKNKMSFTVLISAYFFLAMVFLLLHGDSNLYPFRYVWNMGIH